MGNFNKFFSQIKGRLSKYGSKKLIERAMIIAIIGVVCLIAGSVLFEESPAKEASTKPLADVENANSIETLKQSTENPKNELENNLESILSKIKGAGKVDVMITFISGNESIPAVDVTTSESDTQEKDKEGGSRIIKQADIENKTIFEEKNGEKKPFVVKELLPKVKGVVIVADGVDDVEVKSNLTMAAEALLDIAAHKIQVFKRTSN